jgi:hypothetical protein
VRSFLKNLLLFVSIQALILATVFGFSPPDTKGVIAAGLDKRHRLLTAPSPRLILVGGSSVSNGFDSPTLEKVLKLNVVNMGLHAGLGLSYFLTESQGFVRNGDTVILSIEYAHFFKDQTQWPLVEQSLTLEPGLVKGFNARQICGLLDHGLSLVSLQMKGLFGWKHEGDGVMRSYFNAEGDINLRRPDRPCWVPGEQKTIEAGFLNRPFPEAFNRAVDELNAFNSACAQRGTRVFFFYPPRPRPVWDEAIYGRIDQELRRRLHFPILNHPEDEIYPLSDIFDTDYHLTKSGALERTTHLVKCLEGMGNTIREDAIQSTP